jgi:hypothetical protein
VAQVQAQVERHGRILDAVLRAMVDQAHTLRTTLAAHQTHDACQSGRRQVTEGPLRQTGPQFTWHTVAGRTACSRLQGDRPPTAGDGGSSARRRSGQLPVGA